MFLDTTKDLNNKVDLYEAGKHVSISEYAVIWSSANMDRELGKFG